MLDPRIHHANLLNSILAKMQANAAGVDDALMLDSRGFVAETNATNVFMVRYAAVATPRIVACPEGITRQVILELCHEHAIVFTERDMALAELYCADEVFCSGTMGELTPITTIDGHPIASGAPGPVFDKLSSLFRTVTAASGTQVVD